ILIDPVYQNNWSFNFFSVLIGIFFPCFDIHLWSNPLSCNLYKSKLTWRQNFMFCPVVTHLFFEMVVQSFSVLGFVHVYEVNYYNTSHISEAQLPGNFGSANEVYLKSGIFL